MKRIVFVLLGTLIFLCACSGKEEEKQNTITVEAQDVKAASNSKIEIKTFLDTLTGDPEITAANFLKYSLLEGDYSRAIEFLCQKNRELIINDTLMEYIIYGKSNPAWDSLTALKFDLTRRYMPVLAAMNELREFRKISCDDICLLEYTVAGPMLVRKIFETAFGPDGKRQFDSVVDSNLSLKEKSDYYDKAFKRLALVADSMDMIKRAVTDTLILVREVNQWKVCKDVQAGSEIFKQK